MDSFPTVLEQDTLRLRPMRSEDLAEVAAQIDDAAVSRWLATVQRPFDIAAARALLDHADHPGEHLRLVEQDGTIVGGLCMGHALWYWLKPACWGQGLMRRALTLAIDGWFERDGPPLLATCHEDNQASRVLLARLGFAPRPVGRRMFFQGTQKAEPCRDYVMAPEQWHLLNPPRIAAGRATLRPALQKDAAKLALMLPNAGANVWPEAGSLPAFIERHRFRGPRRGLFVVEDDDRRSIGMALIAGQMQELRFLSDDECARHQAAVETALVGWTSADTGSL